MTPFRVGLVTEGPNDQLVIRSLLGRRLGEAFPSTIVEFVDLQPLFDRTSGSSRGGWTAVYKWCQRNPPARRAASFNSHGIFEGDLDLGRCDAVIVHMDADICEKIGTKSSIPFDAALIYNCTLRGNYIRDVLLSWLWPDGETPDARFIPAPAVMEIEAWLIAALGDDASPEMNVNAKKRLFEIVFYLRATKGYRVPGRLGSGERYKWMSEFAARNAKVVTRKCPHFASLENDVVSAIRAAGRQNLHKKKL